MTDVQFDKLRFLAVKGRWEREHKIMAKDVLWLFDQASRLEVMSDTKTAGYRPNRGSFDDFLDGLAGR